MLTTFGGCASLSPREVDFRRGPDLDGRRCQYNSALVALAACERVLSRPDPVVMPGMVGTNLAALAYDLRVGSALDLRRHLKAAGREAEMAAAVERAAALARKAARAVPSADRWALVGALENYTGRFPASLLSGCATAYHPPAEQVWGYTAESAAYPGVRSLGYSPTPRACEEQHAQDRDKPELAPAHYTLSECRALVITAGAEYWVFSVEGVSGVGSGKSSRSLCEAGRHYVQALGLTPSACAPSACGFGSLRRRATRARSSARGCPSARWPRALGVQHMAVRRALAAA
jgi:hypothetical protein